MEALLVFLAVGTSVCEECHKLNFISESYSFWGFGVLECLATLVSHKPGCKAYQMEISALMC